MPVLNRVRLCNIGHERSFYYDEILELYGPGQTLVAAENGTGKSTVISLILASIRPYSYEFIKGDDNSNRKLEDYVLPHHPAHVICEWIVQKGSKSEYVITGMICELKQGKVDQTFYSYRHPQQITEEFTLDKIPIQTYEIVYTKAEILKLLRESAKNSKAIFKIFTAKSKWMDHLKKFGINSDLFQIQVDMNQSEAGMKSFLKFNSDIDFFLFLVDIITEFKEDENIYEIRDSFKHFKDLNKIEKNIKYLEKFKVELEKGLPFLETQNKILEDVRKNYQFWTQSQQFITDLKIELEKEEDNIKHELKTKTNKKEEIKRQKDEKTLDLNYIQSKAHDINIKNLQEEIDKLSKNNEINTDLVKFLHLLPYIQELKRKDGRLQGLRSKYEEHKPIRINLEETRLMILELFKRKINILKSQNKRRDEQLEQLDHRKSDINETQGKITAEIEAADTQYENNISEIKQINSEEKKYEKFLKDDETFLQCVQRLKQNKSKLTQEVQNIREEVQHINNDLEDCEKSRDEIINRIREITSEKNQEEIQLNQIYDHYRSIITKPIFQAEFEKIQPDKLNIDYSVLSSRNNASLIEKQIQMKNKNDNLIVQSKKLSAILDYFQETQKFPPDENVTALLEFLHEKFPREDFHYGWNYLAQSISTTEREKWAKKIPNYLNGIILSRKSLEPIKNNINKFLTTGEFDFLSAPVLLTSLSIFTQQDQQYSIEDSITIKNDFTWKYDEREIISRKERIEENVELLEEQISDIENQLKQVDQIIDDWDEFLDKYPLQTYKEHRTNVRSLTTSKINLEEKELHMKKLRKNLKERLKNKEKQVDSLEKKLKQLDRIIFKLEILLPKLEKKTELTQKNLKLQKKISSNKAFLLQNEEKIQELRKDIKIVKFETRKTERNINDLEYETQKYRTSYYSFAEEEQPELKIEKLDLIRMQEKFAVLERDYTEKVEKTGIQEEIKQLKKDCESIDKQIEKGKRDLIFDLENSRYKAIETEDLTKIEIENRITDLEQQNNQINSQIFQQKKEKRTLNEHKIRLDELIQPHLPILNEKWVDLPNDLSKLNVKISDVENDLNQLVSQITSLNQTISHLSKRKKETEKFQMNTIRALNEIKTMMLDYQKRDLNFTLSLKPTFQMEKDYLSQIMDSIQPSQDNLDVLDRNYELCRKFFQAIQNIFQEFSGNMLDFDQLEYFETYSMEQFQQLPDDISKVELRKEMFKQKKESYEGRIQNVIHIFALKIENIMDNLKELRKVKLNVPDFPHLDNQPILKFHARKFNDQDLSDHIRQYFQDLFNQYEEFPSDYSSEKIIREILRNFLQIYFKNPQFIFLDQYERLEYDNVVKLKNTSGGELLAFTILLYFLVVNFKIRHERKDTKIKQYFPLIMDNPLGEQNRIDLIAVQNRFATQLGIQMIVFTSLENPDIYELFDTTVSMYKEELLESSTGNEYRNIKLQVEKVQSATISTHPQRLPQIKKLTDMMNND